MTVAEHPTERYLLVQKIQGSEILERIIKNISIYSQGFWTSV